MQRKYVRIAGLFVILLLLTTTMVQAQSKTLYWARWDADITVREDGTFRVIEEQTIEFTSGVFTFGTRGVEMSRLGTISAVEVKEGDQAFQESSSGQPGTFQTYMNGSEFTIKWFFPSTSDSRHTYTIAYTVSDATLDRGIAALRRLAETA